MRQVQPFAFRLPKTRANSVSNVILDRESIVKLKYILGFFGISDNDNYSNDDNNADHESDDEYYDNDDTNVDDLYEVAKVKFQVLGCVQHTWAFRISS